MTAVTINFLALGAVVIFIAVVGTVSAIVQRQFGSKWLWVVWLTPAVLCTGFLLTQVDYNVYPLFSYPVLVFAASSFVLFGFLSGVWAWHTAVWFGPRPLTVPTGKLQDEHGLPGILGRYQRLLTTYAMALDAADPNPYPSLLCVFLSAFRGLSPSSMRWARERVRQMGQVPNILARTLIGAEDVLAELETLTIAQLSAIEEGHRMNVRRLRQGSILGWRWQSQLAGLIGVISTLVLAAEHVGVRKFKDIDLWSLISGITMMGADIRSMIVRGVIGTLVMVLILFITDGIRYLPILQRLRAFEDILTIAKAYRKGTGETTQPSGKPSLTVIG